MTRLKELSMEDIKADRFDPYHHVVKEGDPLLREIMPGAPIDEELLYQAEKMKIYMRRFKAAFGLAAPQVGWCARVVMIDPAKISPKAYPPETPVWGMVNPTVVSKAILLDMESGYESCLSIPDCNDLQSYTTLKGIVNRPRWVDVRYYSTALGKQVTHRFEGMMARVVQHEIDHLYGILISDKLGDEEERDNAFITHQEYLSRVNGSTYYIGEQKVLRDPYSPGQGAAIEELDGWAEELTRTL